MIGKRRDVLQSLHPISHPGDLPWDSGESGTSAIATDRPGLYNTHNKQNDMPTFAVQPADWTNFDSYGCDWAINISHAYKIAALWQEMNQGGDMMIWRVTPGGDPIRWVRVYEDESIDAVTDDALALLV